MFLKQFISSLFLNQLGVKFKEDCFSKGYNMLLQVAAKITTYLLYKLYQ
ncbi:unnamed protein product [Nezara viridula]|uniref:Uncharacterized protein n=1 Tax=Nezara viridula TaxID=85310 RepID=A0A9P0HLA8_NEZVI|nr:unnamed protein product [Nezara viridula]